MYAQSDGYNVTSIDASLSDFMKRSRCPSLTISLHNYSIMDRETKLTEIHLPRPRDLMKGHTGGRGFFRPPAECKEL